jgi:putative radical SAM enzyme (TIGR03279 family)
VALVPVGLTRHRERLPAIVPPDPEYARGLLAWAAPWRRRFLKELGSRLAFASDEFYLLAGRPFPVPAAYEGYPQLGNGVGGCRLFLEEFRRLAPRLPDAVSPPRRVSVVSGALATPVLTGAVERLNRIAGLRVDLCTVRNEFFGGTVTCAGLLTGHDILGTLQAREPGEAVLIPSVTLKQDEDIFLDDLTLSDLSARIGRPALRVQASARELVRAALGGPDAASPRGRGRRCFSLGPGGPGC